VRAALSRIVIAAARRGDQLIIGCGVTMVPVVPPDGIIVAPPPVHPQSAGM
jgi:hypothetical protein